MEKDTKWQKQRKVKRKQNRQRKIFVKASKGEMSGKKTEKGRNVEKGKTKTEKNHRSSNEWARREKN